MKLYRTTHVQVRLPWYVGLFDMLEGLEVSCHLNNVICRIHGYDGRRVLVSVHDGYVYAVKLSNLVSHRRYFPQKPSFRWCFGCDCSLDHPIHRLLARFDSCHGYFSVVHRRPAPDFTQIPCLPLEPFSVAEQNHAAAVIASEQWPNFLDPTLIYAPADAGHFESYETIDALLEQARVHTSVISSFSMIYFGISVNCFRRLATKVLQNVLAVSLAGGHLTLFNDCIRAGQAGMKFPIVSSRGEIPGHDVYYAKTIGDVVGSLLFLPVFAVQLLLPQMTFDFSEVQHRWISRHCADFSDSFSHNATQSFLVIWSGSQPRIFSMIWSISLRCTFFKTLLGSAFMSMPFPPMSLIKFVIGIFMLSPTCRRC